MLLDVAQALDLLVADDLDGLSRRLGAFERRLVRVEGGGGAERVAHGGEATRRRRRERMAREKERCSSADQGWLEACRRGLCTVRLEERAARSRRARSCESVGRGEGAPRPCGARQSRSLDLCAGPADTSGRPWLPTASAVRQKYDWEQVRGARRRARRGGGCTCFARCENSESNVWQLARARASRFRAPQRSSAA